MQEFLVQCLKFSQVTFKVIVKVHFISHILVIFYDFSFNLLLKNTFIISLIVGVFVNFWATFPAIILMLIMYGFVTWLRIKQVKNNREEIIIQFNKSSKFLSVFKERFSFLLIIPLVV